MSRRRRFARNRDPRLPSPLPARDPVGYLRFELAGVPHRSSNGPFVFVERALSVLDPEERAALREVVAWFDAYLAPPRRLVPFRYVGNRRARRRRRGQEGLGRCWFRDDANEHVSRARALVALLERAGFRFVERRSRRLPGVLCSEDAHQIVVVPFRDVR